MEWRTRLERSENDPVVSTRNPSSASTPTPGSKPVHRSGGSHRPRRSKPISPDGCPRSTRPSARRCRSSTQPMAPAPSTPPTVRSATTSARCGSPDNCPSEAPALSRASDSPSGSSRSTPEEATAVPRRRESLSPGCVGRREDLHDLVVAAALRVLERSDAVGIRDLDVRPRVDQDPHDLLVRRPAVAQDHRLEERRPPEIVDVVEVDRRSARAPARPRRGRGRPLESAPSHQSGSCASGRDLHEGRPGGSLRFRSRPSPGTHSSRMSSWMSTSAPASISASTISRSSA